MRNYVSSKAITDITVNSVELVQSLMGEGVKADLSNMKVLMPVIWDALDSEYVLFRDPKVHETNMLMELSCEKFNTCKADIFFQALDIAKNSDMSLIVVNIESYNNIYELRTYAVCNKKLALVMRKQFIDEFLLQDECAIT